MSKVTIVDAPCGAGKTSWAIQEMDSHPDTPYVFCTPFLSEAERIIGACKAHRFKQPQNWEQTKLEDFNSLLAEKEDIAVTHSTFLNATPETVQLIADGNYTLIIDEALDVVQDFNNLHDVQNDKTQKMDEKSIELLLDAGNIRIGEMGKIEWIGKHYGGGKFVVMERLARAGRLYLASGAVTVCTYPPEMFHAFKDVYVLTYLYEGTPICPYFRLFGIEHIKKGVIKDSDVFALCDHNETADKAFREMCAANVHVCGNRAMLMSYEGRTDLSKSWFDKRASKRGQDDIAQLRNHVVNFYRNIGAKATDLITYTVTDTYGAEIEVQSTGIMWTCYKPHVEKLKGKGYYAGKRLTKRDSEELQDRMLCYVPSNAKASNKYKVRWALAYLINMFYPPYMKTFFKTGGVDFDENCYTVSCLIQWLCRSRIRDGLPVELYLPSGRMRRLYQRWLDGEFA